MTNTVNIIPLGLCFSSISIKSTSYNHFRIAPINLTLTVDITLFHLKARINTSELSLGWFYLIYTKVLECVCTLTSIVLLGYIERYTFELWSSATLSENAELPGRYLVYPPCNPVDIRVRQLFVFCRDGSRQIIEVGTLNNEGVDRYWHNLQSLVFTCHVTAVQSVPEK